MIKMEVDAALRDWRDTSARLPVLHVNSRVLGELAMGLVSVGQGLNYRGAPVVVDESVESWELR